MFLVPQSVLNYAEDVGDEERAGVAWGIFNVQASSWLTSHLLMSPEPEPSHRPQTARVVGQYRSLWILGEY